MRKSFILAIVFTLLLTSCGTNIEKTDTEINKDNHTEIITENELLKSEIADLRKLNNELKEKLADSMNDNVEVDNFEQGDIIIVRALDNHIQYISDVDKEKYIYLNIIGDNSDEVVENYESLEIDGLGSGEKFTFAVIGSIYDFELCELKYDEDKQEFYDGEVIAQYAEIKNKVVTIELHLPCGAPLQSIKWKDSNGNTRRYYIGENGYGFKGEIILSK